MSDENVSCPVLPEIAKGIKKPSDWKRIGCGVCGKRLGKFQYAKIGLCNQCRTKTANDLGIKKPDVSVFEADDATWYKTDKETP